MDIARIGEKGQYLNTLEKYYIYKISREKLHMNDTNIDEHNPIFEKLQKIYDTPTSCTPPPLPLNTFTKCINTDDTIMHKHILVKRRSMVRHGQSNKLQNNKT
jgi:hypothetical protein